MDSTQALSQVQPLIDSLRDPKRHRASKAECDELLIALNTLPPGAFDGRGTDLERLWMQALSCLRYSVLLWLYGDASAARAECEKGRWKVEQIRTRIQEPWPAAAPGSLLPSQPAAH